MREPECSVDPLSSRILRFGAIKMGMVFETLQTRCATNVGACIQVVARRKNVLGPTIWLKYAQCDRVS